MIEIIDLDNVIVNGVPQDLVGAIANNLQGDLAGILAALKVWDKGRRAEVGESAITENQKLLENERMDWQQQLAGRDAEISELKRRLVPDLRPIVDALRGVGLYQWMADAANKDPDLLDEIAAMNAAAAAGDVPNLVANYAVIVAAFPPSEELLRSWQAVLDAAGVPPQILAFIQ